MTGFTPKIPTNDLFPHKHMLHDFNEQIKAYVKVRRMDPNYIVINPGDKESLLAEMQSFKLIGPGSHSGKLQFQGIRIIESPDIIKSFFEVLGN